MKARSLAVRAAVTCACVCAVVTTTACQIFGERARCDKVNEGSLHACDTDEFCNSDGFCTKLAPESCPQPPPPATKSVGITVSPTVGVAALGPSLFNQKAALIADVHLCNLKGPSPSSCNGQTSNPAGTQALGALDATNAALPSTVLAGGTLAFQAPDGFDEAKGFTVEAVVKTPPRALSTGGRLTPIVSMAASAQGQDGASFDGWILGVDDDDELVMQAGRVTVFLTAKGTASLAGTWHHVLCSVDAPALAEPDAVLCAIDGKLATRTPNQILAGTLNATHALVFGGLEGSAPSSSGAEVAAVQLWAGGKPEPGLRTLDREDALRDEARARLARYVGVAVDTSARYVVTNQPGLARVQPVGALLGAGASSTSSSTVHFEIVDESWPRLARFGGKTPAILLEPDRINRLDAAVLQCAAGSIAAIASPDGRADACSYAPATTGATIALPTSVVKPISVGRDPDFTTGSDFVFSAFLHMPAGVTNDGASLHVHVEGARGPGFAFNSDCRVARASDGSPLLFGGDGCALLPFAGDWVRLVARMTATSSQLTVTAEANGAVWSPQLELGTDPTTPMAFDPADTDPAGTHAQRLGDLIVFEAPGLANASSTALRAHVVTDTPTLSMTPLFVAEDAAFSDGSAFVSAVTTSAGNIEPRLVVEHNATSVVLGDEVPYAQGTITKIGADLGLPIDPCRGCIADAPQLSPPSPEQWDNVGLTGSQEPGFLVDAEVITAGTAPLPLALDVTADAPQPGCLEGASPDIALVACAQGACPEQSAVSWSAVPSHVAPSPGPSVGELAVEGTFNAKIAAPKVVDELFVEARFAAHDGDVLALFADDKPASAPFFRIADVGGAAVVSDGGGHEVLHVDGALEDGAWNQITCWVGVQSVCAVNAGALVTSDVAVDVAKPLARATVSGHVAFARVWRTSAAEKVAIERIVGARVAASFGFNAPARRAEFQLVENRATSATIARSGASFTVGPHWPRIVDGPSGPVYVSDADGESLSIATRDLSSFDATTVEMSFDNAPSGTLITLSDKAGTESLTLSRNGSELDVAHSAKSVGGAIPTAQLAGVDANTVLFGSRDSVFTLEGLTTPPTLVEAAAPASLTPLTVANLGAHVQLRHLRLATR